jgi:hypothetical protein
VAGVFIRTTELIFNGSFVAKSNTIGVIKNYGEIVETITADVDGRLCWVLSADTVSAGQIIRYLTPTTPTNNNDPPFSVKSIPNDTSASDWKTIAHTTFKFVTNPPSTSANVTINWNPSLLVGGVIVRNDDTLIATVHSNDDSFDDIELRSDRVGYVDKLITDTTTTLSSGSVICYLIYPRLLIANYTGEMDTMGRSNPFFVNQKSYPIYAIRYPLSPYNQFDVIQPGTDERGNVYCLVNNGAKVTKDLSVVAYFVPEKPSSV